MGNECNNFNKENYSRPAIAAVINNHFKDKEIFFLELLGSGEGVNYYVRELDNLKCIVAVERNKLNFSIYNDNVSVKYKCLGWNKIGTVYHPVYNMYNRYVHLKRIDLNKYLNKTKFQFNVINLDFCTYLRTTDNINSPIIAINNTFRNNRIANNGLIFFTFQLTGVGVNWATDAITNRKEIFDAVNEVALKHGYSLEEVFYYQYKSGNSTTMCNLGVKVTKINE